MKKILLLGAFASLAVLGAGCSNSTAVSVTPPLTITDSTSTVTIPEAPVPTTSTTTFTLKNGHTLNLTMPSAYHLNVYAEGYKHLRFMAKSPDNRLFVGEMTTADDTSTGHVFIFDGSSTHTYLSNLRNPNSVAFYTDPSGQTWLYVAQTDKLIRYKYQAGDNTPEGPGETVSTFPAYGRPWTNGGWHLTRTLVPHNDKLYVSVGSSCNSCEEKLSEPTRGTILEMNPDGSKQRTVASGLRNAVGIQFAGDALYATVNGPDHLGNDKPNDTFFKIKDGQNYGWPYCYQYNGQMFEDNSQKWQHSINCGTVPLANYAFAPHSAPLGFDTFDGQFLVALHGSGNKNLNIGYKVIAIDQNTYAASDLITGFIKNGVVTGRPVGILKNDDNSFFLTDDWNGAVYLVQKS